jgi:hypothetical protein
MTHLGIFHVIFVLHNLCLFTPQTSGMAAAAAACERVYRAGDLCANFRMIKKFASLTLSLY